MEEVQSFNINLAYSINFLSGFYCWDWEFLTALLLFSCSI
ncbi:hypothetical protein DCAR_0729568 [Daucus carota subsp. sativus]|uniref:Uncharacterized protein n=1 Tax=Daucus carota subsp. sativus TaxID=79200 RepID=A0AAF0XL29_DAUCS|nr:PREDICTED: uncharacterized protein LOC108194975 [Daucus carota subsp. sativus]WOH10106.1 hypothetical protein DCAR_0729568 [Daucus carota subsp. sativus]